MIIVIDIGNWSTDSLNILFECCTTDLGFVNNLVYTGSEAYEIRKMHCDMKDCDRTDLNRASVGKPR